MTDESNKNATIGQTVKSHWILITQFVMWGFQIVSAIVAPPTLNALACAPGNPNCVQSTENWTRYILAFVVVFALIPTWLWSKRRHLPGWILATVVVFSSSYYLNSLYYKMSTDWVCEVEKTPLQLLRIKGETLTPTAERAKESPRCKSDPPCKNLLLCFGTDPEQVWKAEEIHQRRFYLTAVYQGSVSLMFVGIIFLTQVLFCALKRPEREIFQGSWIEKDHVGDKPVTLEIVAAEKRISGILKNFDTPAGNNIQNAKIEKGTLKFDYGRQNTKFEVYLVSENQVTLTKKENNGSTDWQLVRR